METTMKKFIQLTGNLKHNNIVYIDASKILAVHDNPEIGGSGVVTETRHFCVVESPEEILKKIEESQQ